MTFAIRCATAEDSWDEIWLDVRGEAWDSHYCTVFVQILST